MPAPTITPLPDAPSRTEEPATFVTKADAFVEALEGLPGEINAFGDYLGGLALEGVAGPITSTALGMSTGKLLGRSTASTGAIEEITVGTGLSLSGGTLSAARTYRIGFFITTAPSASEVLLLHIVSDACTLPANFSTSRGAVGANPAGSFVLDVQQQVNATGAFSSIGTITISTGGAFTFATTSGTAKSIAAGDVIKVVGPATPDASIANVAVTLVGAI
ncbi:hypothetical protein [Sphingobium bisphenolivorans]|uniref:hypothetical protein n=1 Tax=Sphingobium bisphenolivorans TaxID=1335760 RepID=UPI00039EABE4|nr:hypothetical protein [Sphingobium bisphenolivorans]